jgi:hypothetical protein
MADLTDFENFMENYKWTYCESLFKQYAISRQQFEKCEYKILISLAVTERRLIELPVTVDYIVPVSNK